MGIAILLLVLVMGLASISFVSVTAQEAAASSDATVTSAAETSSTVVTVSASPEADAAESPSAEPAPTSSAADDEATIDTAPSEASASADEAEAQPSDDELTPQADDVCQIGTTKYATLGAALTAATDGQTIEMLVSDYTFDDADCTSISDKSITLTTAASVGKNCTITRATKATMVTVDTGTLIGTGTLTMSNLVIEGGGSTLAANHQAFVMKTNGKITATGCTFQNVVNEKATGGQYRGGVFYGTQGATTELTLNSCTFNNCSANYGAVALSYSTVTATGCKFTGCASSGGNGGAIFIGNPGVLTVTNSTFFNCTSASNGGAIGGEENTSVSVDGCTFGSKEFPCTAKAAGGAIYMPWKAASLQVTNSAFSYCTGTSNSGGGAIASAAVSNTFEGTAQKPLTIKNCSSGGNGGGIYIFSSATSTSVSHVQVADCSSSASGGGICVSVSSAATATLTASDLSISNCTATSNCGGLYSNCGSTSLNGTVAQPISITGCTAGGNGAGVFLASTVTTGVMTNTTISSCSAKASGGGLYMDGTSTTADRFKATDVTITNNTAAKYGGGAYTAGATLTTCTITGNTATNARGGGLETYGQPTTVTGCDISGNTSGGSGGGIDTNGAGPLAISSTTISGNQATGSNADGGGIFMINYNGDPVVHLRDGTTITGNSCGRSALGGGVGTTAASSQLLVSGLVNITGNTNANDQESNVELYNSTSNSSDYEVYVEGSGLSFGSTIGVITRDNGKGELCVKGATGYTLTEKSDLSYFSHDRVTRGQDKARLIVWDSNTSTYVLGGSVYQVQHWTQTDASTWAEDKSLREDHVDLVGTTFDQAKQEGFKKTIQGYTTEATLQYLVGTNWVDLPTTYALPGNDDLIIRVRYDKKDYDVTFETEDSAHGTVSGALTQSVGSGYKPTGTVTATPATTDWFFIGWSYTMTDDAGKVTKGYVYDYKDLPIGGTTVFTAMFAKQPFASILTTGGGSVAITKGSSAPSIPTGQLSDKYEWEATTTSETFEAMAAIRADEHYHVKSITAVMPTAESDNSLELTLSDTAAQTLHPTTLGATATLSLNTANTYGTIHVESLPKAVSLLVEFAEDPTYKVSFYEDATTLFEEHDGLYDKDQIGNAPASVPVKDGYTFVGWTSVAPDASGSWPAGTRPDYDPGSRIAAADQTYYALWQENSDYSYQVQIYLQNPGTDSTKTSSYTLSESRSYPFNVASGTTVTEPYATYTGYEANTDLSNNTGTVTKSDADAPLVLRLYYKVVQKTVTYYDSDGTTKLFDDATVDYGATVPLPTPTKAGYTFEGWYYDKDYVSAVPTGATMPEYDLPLYAKWEAATTGNLVVSKDVTGAYADLTRSFEFTATIGATTDPATTYTGQVHDAGGAPSGSPITITAGTTFSFSLSTGQYLEVDGVAINSAFDVKETDSSVPDQYTASVTATTDTGATAPTITGTQATGTLQSSVTTLTYTDTRVDVPETAVNLGDSNLWAGVVVGTSACLLAILLRRRRARR